MISLRCCFVQLWHSCCPCTSSGNVELDAGVGLGGYQSHENKILVHFNTGTYTRNRCPQKDRHPRQFATRTTNPWCSDLSSCTFCNTSKTMTSNAFLVEGHPALMSPRNGSSPTKGEGLRSTTYKCFITCGDYYVTENKKDHNWERAAAQRGAIPHSSDNDTPQGEWEADCCKPWPWANH